MASLNGTSIISLAVHYGVDGAQSRGLRVSAKAQPRTSGQCSGKRGRPQRRTPSRPLSSTDPGKEEDHTYQAQQREYKRNAVNNRSNPYFLVLAFVADVAKSPLSRFLQWGQKAVNTYNGERRNAQEAGVAYVGPTPHSKLVASEADCVSARIDALLGAASEKSCDTWEGLWETVPYGLEESARCLIAQLVLKLKAYWSFRVIRRVTRFPLALLHFLSDPPETRYRVIRVLAESFMTSDVDDDPVQDVCSKMRLFFQQGVSYCSELGHLSPSRCMRIC